ncbi:MAG: AAA family ATPase [Chloroflexi bacterium]|nr:AAA family ATPase [Chloroflexota bacterium]
MLRSVRLLTLTGSAGIGKTRLALKVARLLESQLEHGVALVDLAPMRDSDMVPRTIAAAVGVRERGRREVLDSLQEELGCQQRLIVLDNCEHLLLSSARAADAPVSSCPHYARRRLAGDQHAAAQRNGSTAENRRPTDEFCGARGQSR